MNGKSINLIPIAALGLLFLLLLSCASTKGLERLPDPLTENEAVLIVPVVTVKKGAGKFFGRYKVQLSGDQRFLFNPTFGSKIVTNVPPGKYRIQNVQFLYKGSNERGGKYEANLKAFELKPGHIMVLPYTFVIGIERKGDTTWQYWDIRKTTPQEEQEIWTSLREKSNFGLWKNDYYK